MLLHDIRHAELLAAPNDDMTRKHLLTFSHDECSTAARNTTFYA